MASTVMANWGGVQLLDTVEVGSSDVSKGADYMVQIGASNFDFLYLTSTKIWLQDNSINGTGLSKLVPTSMLLDTSGYRGLIAQDIIRPSTSLGELYLPSFGISGSWSYRTSTDNRYKYVYHLYGIKL